MIILLCPLVLCQFCLLMQVDAISKRSSGTPDLSTVIAEDKLPRDIAPTGYILDLHPFPDDGYFKGRIIINLVWVDETNKIILHADPDLVVYQPDLVLIENNELTRTIKIARSERDTEHSWYVIYLRRYLSAGTEAQLSMSFTGKLNTESQEGLFVSSYEDSSVGEDKNIVGSNFKPNFARKVFPCFDEPEYKAPFEISIVRKESMSSISSMPLVRTEPILYDSSWSRDYFQESLPMSTFSVGILITELSSITLEEGIDGEKNFDSAIQIWGLPDILEAAENVTKDIFEAVNNMGEAFNLPYFLPKLDYVFIPGVEMNSWGLITQEDTYTLHIFYNVVYQWIGHLVTPGLWTDEKINEVLRFLIATYIKPGIEEYQEAQDHLALYSMSYVDHKFQTDQNQTNTDDEAKIALLFRMLTHTLSETTLKQGLQRFISQTKYKTFIETDLWNAITDQARVDGTLPDYLSVTQIADSWILSTRVPIITVKRNYRDNSATISQKPYESSKTPNDGESDHKWIVPIVVVKENNLDFTNMIPAAWLKEESCRLTKLEKRDRFVIVNPEQIGPFVVNYDERNWKLISDFLRKQEREQIPQITRAKLLHDAFNLANAGELNYKVAFDLIPSLENENQSLVWGPFLDASSYIEKYLSESSTIYEKYLRFLRGLLLSIYDRINNDENEENSYLKDFLKHNLCKIGYQSCLDEAKNYFERYIDAPEETYCPIDLYTHSCNVFRWGGDEDYELGYLFLGSYTAENGTSFSDNPVLKSIMSCSAQPWKIEQMLNMSLFGHAEDFTDSDVENILQMLSEYFIGYNTLFGYLNDNWDALLERFENNQDLWKKFIETAISNFKTQEGLEAVRSFYEEKREELSWAESTIEEAIKKVEEEVARSNVYYPAIEEWLDDYLKDHEENTGDNFFP